MCVMENTTGEIVQMRYTGDTLCKLSTYTHTHRHTYTEACVYASKNEITIALNKESGTNKKEREREKRREKKTELNELNVKFNFQIEDELNAYGVYLLEVEKSVLYLLL